MASILLKNKGLTTEIDDSELCAVNQYNWYGITCSNKEYAAAKVKGKQMLLHRFIIGETNPKVFIDHIDSNGLNNTRSNLRRATAAQNNSNKKSTGKSKYLGVHKLTRHGSNGKSWSYWVAVCSKNGRRQSKNFPHTTQGERDAAIYYNNLAIKLHGDFSKLNTLETITSKRKEVNPIHAKLKALKQANRDWNDS